MTDRSAGRKAPASGEIKVARQIRVCVAGATRVRFRSFTPPWRWPGSPTAIRRAPGRAASGDVEWMRVGGDGRQADSGRGAIEAKKGRAQ